VLRRLVLLCAKGCLLAATLAAANVSGIWTGQVTDKNGDPVDLSFRFEQNGDKLAGKMYGDNESTPISDGKVDGDQVTFSVGSELNGSISSFVYVGKIEGGEIIVTREHLPVKPKGPPKQVVRLKRVA
jgi:hypothetical protein